MMIATILLLAGCSNKPSWQVDTYPVTGKITVNGQPAPHSVVMFHYIGEPPDKRKSIPFARADQFGTYTLTTYNEGDGAPVGEYAITAYWPPDPSANIDQLKMKFVDPKNPVKVITVQREKNDIPITIETTELNLVPAPKGPNLK